MSKKSNLAVVFMAFILDIFGVYAWYVGLFPTDPITTFDATIGGAVLMLLSLLIVGANALLFSIALAED